MLDWEFLCTGKTDKSAKMPVHSDEWKFEGTGKLGKNPNLPVGIEDVRGLSGLKGTGKAGKRVKMPVQTMNGGF